MYFLALISQPLGIQLFRDLVIGNKNICRPNSYFMGNKSFSQLFTRRSQANNYHASSLICLKPSALMNSTKSNFEGIFEDVL